VEPGSHLILYEEDLTQINACLIRLHHDARSKAVFLIDKNGQLIGSAGETTGLDTTALASLAAGNIAATGGLAQLLGQREFSILFHEGERDHLHISVIGGQVILLVLFDHRSSLGLIRLKAKKASEEIGQIFEELTRKLKRDPGEGRTLLESAFAEITDEDIDNLFGKG
jgi:predicted regulator of Ras-like GTPase activity (Roadblock/LC7/MglB family)